MGQQLIALAIPVFFLFIAIELWVAKRRGLSVYRLGDALADLGCGIGQQLVTVLVATVAVTSLYEWVYQHRLITLPGGWVPWVVATLGYDLGYYWWHRLSHEVNFLWAGHVVHHHSEDYNLAVALRQSISTWATSLWFYLPLALIGVPTFVFAITGAISLVYQFFIHTQLVPDLGPVERVLNTPALHRVHHAINPGYLDKNHAAIFSIWDQLFGTFTREREPCVYGTTRPINSFNPLWAQVEGYVELWRLSRKAPGWKKAVKVWFASPAWWEPWMGEVEKRDWAKKYDPPVSPAVRRYALAQFAVMSVGVVAFIMWGHLLSWPARVVAAGLVVLSLAALAALVEGRPWARWLEAARLAVLPLLAVVFLGGWR